MRTTVAPARQMPSDAGTRGAILTGAARQAHSTASGFVTARLRDCRVSVTFLEVKISAVFRQPCLEQQTNARACAGHPQERRPQT